MSDVNEGRCESVLDGDRCEKVKGHRGKHASYHGKRGEIQFCQWTNAGLAEFLKEQRRKAAKTTDQSK